jgi:precorrin-3B synthase
MTAHALNLPRRRGACPGLSAPMATGDGLLVRLMPTGTMALDAFAALCAAARQDGNGVIEVTSRGSIQIRGLSPASALRFAADIADFGIAAEDSIPVLSNPLAGLDADDIIDAGALAAEVRQALAGGRLAQKLSAKVSVTIDGGGALNLDAIAADVRLSAEAIDRNAAIRISVGGTAASTAHVGIVALHDAATATMRLLDVLAQHGHDMRARDVVAAKGIAPFHTATADLIVSDNTVAAARRSRDAIGSHVLRDGSLAHGIGLAFGHADATSLERLVDAAAAAGASGIHTAPGRALIVIGLKPRTSPAFAAAAGALGFIVRADDPRRRVVACAGAPICASAEIASRTIAPLVAEIAAPFAVHISGCAKGCAHPAPTALTVVGTPQGCALIADGTARDAPFKIVPTDELPAAIAEFAHGGCHV